MGRACHCRPAQVLSQCSLSAIAPRKWFSNIAGVVVSRGSPGLGRRVTILVERVLEGFLVFSSPAQTVVLLVLSAGLWGAAVVQYYCVGQALRLDVAAPEYVVVLFATAIGAIIPGAPVHSARSRALLPVDSIWWGFKVRNCTRVRRRAPSAGMDSDERHGIVFLVGRPAVTDHGCQERGERCAADSCRGWT